MIKTMMRLGLNITEYVSRHDYVDKLLAPFYAFIAFLVVLMLFAFLANLILYHD